MTVSLGRESALYVALFVLAAALTLFVHAVFVPRYLPAQFLRGLPYLLAGWGTFAVACYALGRLLSSPEALASMRTLDGGLAVFLASVVLSGLLDTAGLTVQQVPLAHAIPAVGVYVGLALAGWGFGERAALIERVTEETPRR